MLKKIESRLYGFYNRRQRIRYANNDLQKKISHMQIKPISNEQFDIVKSFYSKYGIKVKKEWFDLFNTLNGKNGAKLHYYIPHDIYYGHIDTHFSDVRKAGFCDDKALYDVYFHDIKQPRTIIRRCYNKFGKSPLWLDEHYNLITKEQAIQILASLDKFIVKQASYSSGGKGIRFYNSESGDSIEQILEGNDNIVIQEIVKQHEVLNYIHENSVNTIRIMSLIINNEVHILSSVLRMGQGGAKVDNASSGGIFAGITANGKLKDVAYNCDGVNFDKHPQGAIFSTVTIPNFNKCVELVKKLAPRISTITRLCSWDIAIDYNGEPTLIEANLTFGEIDFHQMCNGAIFGNLTETVLSEVFGQ